MIQVELVLALVLIFSAVLCIYHISRQLEAIHEVAEATLEKLDDLVVQTSLVNSKDEDFLKKSSDDFDGNSTLSDSQTSMDQP